jgi:hypothetical protein
MMLQYHPALKGAIAVIEDFAHAPKHTGARTAVACALVILTTAIGIGCGPPASVAMVPAPPCASANPGTIAAERIAGTAEPERRPGYAVGRTIRHRHRRAGHGCTKSRDYRLFAPGEHHSGNTHLRRGRHHSSRFHDGLKLTERAVWGRRLPIDRLRRGPRRQPPHDHLQGPRYVHAHDDGPVWRLRQRHGHGHGLLTGRVANDGG